MNIRMYVKKLAVLLMACLILTACTTTGKGSRKGELTKPVLIERPERFFWEIKGEKGSVYVLGTVHVADKSFYPLEKNVLDAFDTADRLVSEIGGLSEMQELGAELQNVIMKNINADPKKSLLTVLSKEDIAFLDDTLGSDTVQKLSVFNPWVLNTVLTQLLFSKTGLHAEDGLDMHLMQRAAAKKISALDTMEQQLKVLTFGNFDDQLALLKDTIQGLRDIDTSLLEMHTIREFYLSNNRKELAEKMVTLLLNQPESFSEKTAHNFIDTLLTERNHIWAKKFDRYLREEGNTFVFAGVMHFLGKSNVFEIMRQNHMIK